jgi:uncharacterized membrane protein (DUF485 family)
VHVDGKIVRSVWLLVTRPGFLTREQFEGRRARYISPIRLYLIFSVIYFAVAAFAPLSGPTINCSSCPSERKEIIEREMREAVVHWAPRAMVVLIPLLAGAVALAARPAGRNFPQHLYFALHVNAAWFFAGAVMGLATLVSGPSISTAITKLGGLYFLVYLALAFRTAYGTSWLRATVSAVSVFFVYIMAVALVLMAIIIPTLETAAREEMHADRSPCHHLQREA